MSIHVAVLMGGLSAEREVSLVSGKACAEALEARGYQVTSIDVGDDVVDQLRAAKPDCVFNALHGRFGEDGRIQGMLDLMRIPYSHSGVLASALAMDKPLANRLLSAEGVRCPEHVIATLPDILENPPVSIPFVVKPTAEGSSVGVVIVEDEDLNTLRIRNDIDPSIHLMVEKYIPGRELTCGVLNDEALTITEIESAEGFYDYRAKYTEGGSFHRLPADIPEAIAEAVMEMAKKAHRVLGCRGATRSDFRFNPTRGEDGLFFLEINTQPGMTPLSLLPEQAAWRGIPFDELVVRLIKEARCDA